MSLKKVSAATIIALSLAACSSGSDSPNSTLPNTNPTVTNPSNGSQTNNGNAAANNENNAASNGNTAANANNPANSGNTAANNPPPRVDFSVSYEGIKNTADKDIRELAQQKKINGAVILKSYKVNLGNQSSSGNNFDLSSIPLKTLISQNYQETVVARAEGQNHTITRNGVAHIYRQNYSLIAGITPTGLTLNGESEKLDADDDDTNILIKGYTTQNLPTAGKFDYSGIASDGDKKGKLAYSVDFDSRKGSGKITGLDSDIHLNEAEIKKMSYTNKETDGTTIKGHGIEGSSNRGSYRLGFFGPNAEEIVGTVDDRQNGEIGFAGSR
ncbi:factor H binding protein domain-containing protein [Neisseria sicca]|uniref:factor H binding protein domain-containing protein n=1 Tax=Neisseria sicca TaxID=490 RepID=UPI0028E33DDB|nr:factor H binding protein domain-containing protein [Neisseria sicca]